MVDLLEWKKQYCIGDETIDAEHQKLFDLANEVLVNNILKSSHQITVLAEKLAAMMVKWVLKHILEEDTKIKPSPV
jgi:hemerythrin